MNKIAMIVRALTMGARVIKELRKIPCSFKGKTVGALIFEGFSASVRPDSSTISSIFYAIKMNTKAMAIYEHWSSSVGRVFKAARFFKLCNDNGVDKLLVFSKSMGAAKTYNALKRASKKGWLKNIKSLRVVLVDAHSAQFDGNEPMIFDGSLALPADTKIYAFQQKNKWPEGAHVSGDNVVSCVIYKSKNIDHWNIINQPQVSVRLSDCLTDLGV